MKNIVIPTDFSDNAWDAMLYAFKLYDAIPARFFIINTFQNNTSNTSNIENIAINNHSKKESLNGLRQIQDHLDRYLLNENHDYKTTSLQGDLAHNLQQIVGVENIDIIVMGTTGATGAKEIFIGSNAVKVIDNIYLCPVLAVPKDYEFSELKTITIATDLKKNFSAFDLTSVVELQAIHNSEIKIFHSTESNTISEDKSGRLKAITSIFKEDTISFIASELEGKVAGMIIDFSTKENIDLLCLLNAEKNFLQRFLEEAIVKKVNFHSKIPILNLPV